mgnify:CR=1 FL=1
MTRITIDESPATPHDVHQLGDEWQTHGLRGRIERLSPWHWRLHTPTGTHDAWLLGHDADTGSLRLRVGRQTLHLRVESQRMQYLHLIGVDATAQRKAADLKAPMPGLVKAVLVEAGQAVEAGQSLLVLEAMKMENVLKASAPATVADIPATIGQAVEKGALLIRFS